MKPARRGRLAPALPSAPAARAGAWLARRAALALALLAFTPVPARADDAREAQRLVDQSVLALDELLALGDGRLEAEARRLLRESRAVVLCPRVLRAGFIFGGRGGGCVMLGRADGGGWTAPAFFGMGGAGVGFQIGVQDAAVLMFVRSERALEGLLDSQLSFGGDAGLAIATLGGGVQGGTTTALEADLVTIARARGLFAGLSLEGSLLSARGAWNRAYFGEELAARQILRGAGANPGADRLRAALAEQAAR